MAQSTDQILAERLKETTLRIEEEKAERRAARAARQQEKERAKKAASRERVFAVILFLFVILVGAIIRLVFSSPAPQF